MLVLCAYREAVQGHRCRDLQNNGLARAFGTDRSVQSRRFQAHGWRESCTRTQLERGRPGVVRSQEKGRSHEADFSENFLLPSCSLKVWPHSHTPIFSALTETSTIIQESHGGKLIIDFDSDPVIWPLWWLLGYFNKEFCLKDFAIKLNEPNRIRSKNECIIQWHKGILLPGPK